MTETAAKATFLTQEAYDRLKAELAELSGPARTEIAKKIDAARQEGDLRENGGYHAAREEQGKMEARIRQLEQLLDTAIIGETPPDDGIVEPGMVVTVEPGVYLEGRGGVRTEDTLLVRDGAPRSLTASPRELLEVG